MKSFIAFGSPGNLVVVGNSANTVGQAISLMLTPDAIGESPEEGEIPTFYGIEYVSGSGGFLDSDIAPLLAKTFQAALGDNTVGSAFGISADFRDMLNAMDLTASDAGLFRTLATLPVVDVDGQEHFDTAHPDWIALLEDAGFEVTMSVD